MNKFNNIYLPGFLGEFFEEDPLAWMDKYAAYEERQNVYPEDDCDAQDDLAVDAYIEERAFDND